MERKLNNGKASGGWQSLMASPRSCAGLAPVLQVAERAGLRDLVGERLRIAKPGGCNGQVKVPTLVAGMIRRGGQHR